MSAKRKVFFFFQNHSFQAFLVSKTYIFIHIKKKHKIVTSANSSGGGVKALADASAKNAIFFCMCSPIYCTNTYLIIELQFLNIDGCRVVVVCHHFTSGGIFPSHSQANFFGLLHHVVGSDEVI